MAGERKEAGEAHQVAHYLAAMSDDLATLARRHGLDTLAYLLDMARLEAEQHARLAGRPRSDRVTGT